MYSSNASVPGSVDDSGRYKSVDATDHANVLVPPLSYRESQGCWMKLGRSYSLSRTAAEVDSMPTATLLGAAVNVSWLGN